MYLHDPVWRIRNIKIRCRIQIQVCLACFGCGPKIIRMKGLLIDLFYCFVQDDPKQESESCDEDSVEAEVSIKIESDDLELEEKKEDNVSHVPIKKVSDLVFFL